MNLLKKIMNKKNKFLFSLTLTFIFSFVILLLFDNKLTINVYAEDIPSSWAQEEVASAIALGLVPSELQSNYQGNITREDFCKLAVKMLEVYSSESIDEILIENNSNNYNNPFKEKTICKEILACYNLGIVNGDTSGYFRSSDYINRQEAAKILTITSNIFGRLEDESLIDFEDSKDIGKWAQEYVDFVVLKGIMNGVKAQTHIYFKPRSYYTRQQAILTIYRLYNRVTRFDNSLVYNADNFITEKVEGLDSELKIYNFDFDKEEEKYNYVDVDITQSDYEFKISMSDKNNKVAEINIIGKYVMLASCELDGNEDESELYLKYLDINEKEYIKILKYEGDHFDTLLTLINVEYFGNEVKGDGKGKIYGSLHILEDGSVNGYYDLNQNINIERVIDPNAKIKTTVKKNMVGAVAIYNNKEIVITSDLRDELGLNIGDEITVSDLYKYTNYVTVTTKNNKTIRVVVTK